MENPASEFEKKIGWDFLYDWQNTDGKMPAILGVFYRTRFEVLYRNGSECIYQNCDPDDRKFWEQKNRSNDIMAWRFISEIR